LKAGERDGWFKHLVNRRLVVLHEEYHENKKGFQKEITEAILHTFPKILFVSLPLFALMLRLLNIRRRKEILYVDHGIFTIHLYCASFIIILAMILISTLFTAIGWGNEAWIPDMILVLAFFFYQYKAMHNFYQQGRAKTIVKMVILDFFSIFLLTITTVFFIFWTVMEI
jgi:predicted membrane channel-forming protein YqfA (hemolysin III family)